MNSFNASSKPSLLIRFYVTVSLIFLFLQINYFFMPSINVKLRE